MNIQRYEKTKEQNDTEVTEMENYRLQKRGRVERMHGRTFPKENVWHKPYGKSSEKSDTFSDKCEQLKKIVFTNNRRAAI